MAKAENKKISINALERVVKDYASSGDEWAQDIIVPWAGLDVTVHRVIPLRDVIGFVERVARACFSADTNEYIPEVKDLAIRSNILDTYANFTMPKSADLQHKFVYGTDAVDMVLSHIDRKQFSEVLRAVDAKIDYIVRCNVDAMEKRVNDAVDAVMNFIKKFDGIIDGIENDDVANLVNAITSGKIDEEKVVKAFIENKYDDAQNNAPEGNVTPISEAKKK